MQVLALKEYIEKYHKTQLAFAKFLGRAPQHVNQMLRQAKPVYVLVEDGSIKILSLSMQIKTDS